ncbi:tellurite resistance TerB family protein [Klebsiella pneumoniae]|uniref:tellurite resistance TerB family protein n=1 Tax=Klebsiella pneumoniae TaxID=573 RepID=UPI003D360A3A
MGSCAAPSAKGDDKFITTDYLQQCQVKGALTSGREELTRQVGRYKNKKFMQGTVAVCARIAVASDGVSSEEKQKMIGFLRSSEELKVFDTAEVIEFFNKLVTSFDFDLEIGKGETMKYILALKDQPEAAQLALRVGIAVAKSDGNFDDDEKSAVREIARSLGFDPAEFGL